MAAQASQENCVDASLIRLPFGVVFSMDGNVHNRNGLNIEVANKRLAGEKPWIRQLSSRHIKTC